jgi:hypothetical protein
MRTGGQSGSALAVIVAVLFVALMAALGVIFYQNFIQKDTAAPVEQVAIDPNADVATLQLAFGGTIYEATYPSSGWKAVNVPQDAAAGNEKVATFTSDNGAVRVMLTLSEGGLGGVCDVNDGRKISYYSVDTTPNETLTSEPLYLVEAIIDAAGGGYRYTIGLTPDSGATHAAVGQSACNVQAVGIASSLATKDSAVVRPTIIASITLPALDAENKNTIPEMQPIKDVFATSEFRDAIAILKSTRKKE